MNSLLSYPSTNISDFTMMDTSTSGTGAVTLASKTGYSTFDAGGIMHGDIVPYTIKDANGAWEIGKGIYNVTTPSLSRTKVVKSSNSDALISLSGSATVHIGLNSFEMGGFGSPLVTRWGHFGSDYLNGVALTDNTLAPSFVHHSTLGGLWRATTQTTVGSSGSQGGRRATTAYLKYSTGSMNSGYLFRMLVALGQTSNGWAFIGASNGGWGSTSANVDAWNVQHAGFWFRPSPSALAHTNWQFMTSNNSVNAADTGVAVVADRFYDMLFYVLPGASEFFWRIKDTVTGTIVYGTKTTSLPVSTTLLYPQYAVGNMLAGAARNMYLRYFECATIDNETP